MFPGTFTLPDMPPLMEPVPTPNPHLVPTQGAGLGFSDDAAGVPLLPQSIGQQWDNCATWSGLPLYRVGTLPTFVLSVPLPSNVSASPYCGKMGQLVSAITGQVLKSVSLDLKLMASTDTLYVMATGGLLYEPMPDGTPNTTKPITILGPVRLKVGGVVSAPFEYIPADACYLEIRLAHTSPIGNLLYTNFGFEQRFGVSGTLEGPSFSTTADEATNSGSLTKSYTLTITDAGESVAEALALVAQHSTVEVRTIGSNGQVKSVVAAMANKATSTLTPDTDRFTVELTLPVSVNSWGSGSAAGCVGSTDPLTVIVC